MGGLCWLLSAGLLGLYAWNQSGPRLSCDEAYRLDECKTVEFKSALRWDPDLQGPNRAVERMIVKSVAAFLNSDGGILLIGVTDQKDIVGLDSDFQTLKKPNRDGWELHLRQLLSSAIGPDLCARNVRIGFCRLSGKEVGVIYVKRARRPVVLREGPAEVLYVRVGNASRPLNTRDALVYAAEQWG